MSARSADTGPDWVALDAALDQALDMNESERDGFLASLDPALRAALDPLLRDALRADSFLEQAEAMLAPLVSAPEAVVEEGVRVGPYRIDALIGEGGMGRVYRAHRADGAFDQTVALKVVRQSLALAGTDVAARLRRERDFLATLDPPGIARLIDGGETSDGVPYLVTEFVDGAPITTWADAHALVVRDRVRLVAEVARAVDHAHRRFVVHRDLKPSNVLVTERDGAPRPVVLDFGIAKLLAEAEEGTGAFPLTRTGMRMLTPAYAAPELFDSTLGVTAAADVYGLGALLYELLTGARPHGDAPVVPVTEPTRPSQVVREARAQPTSSTGALARSLRGDLDVICLKALHPDPARRYPSAADLAVDLERHLDGRPVEARPDSLWYVAGRFARRNRAAVATGALALLFLVGGLASSLVSLDAERAAHAEAEAEARRATESVALLSDVFLESDPYHAGQDVTVREVLGTALDRVRTMSTPETRSRMLVMFGHLHNQWGEFSQSEDLYREAAQAASGGSVEQQAEARYGLGRSLGAQGRYREALSLFEQVYADLATEPDLVPLRFRVLRDVAWIQREQGNVQGAIRTAERAVEIGRALDEEETSLALYELASTLLAAGRADAALPFAQEVYDIDTRLFGRLHAESAHAIGLLGEVQYRLSHLDEAARLQSDALAIQRRALGRQHPYTAQAHVALARTLLAAGDARGGVAQADSALALAAGIRADSSLWQSVLGIRAAALNQAGRFVEAEQVAREGLGWVPQEDPADTVELDAHWALARLGQGRAVSPSLRATMEALDRSDPLLGRLYARLIQLQGGSR